jgi:hypothetical protein
MKAYFSFVFSLAFFLASTASAQKLSATQRLEIGTRDQVLRHRLVKANGDKIVKELREEEARAKIRKGLKLSNEKITTIVKDSVKYVQRVHRYTSRSSSF